MWLIPYGYATGKKPIDYSELERVAKIGGNALMAVNNKKWEIGNSADILYACAGASDDWAKIKADVKYAYTLELRPASGTLNGFVVAASLVVSDFHFDLFLNVFLFIISQGNRSKWSRALRRSCCRCRCHVSNIGLKQKPTH